MIVGKGLFACAMKDIDRDGVIFFCSGVSNSEEVLKENFDREKKLLKNYYGTNDRIIYFSSYFVNFSGYQAKPYYRHKAEMEELVSSNFRNYTIFRLPQVVGRSFNSHTLTNFIYSMIKSNTKFNLYSNAKRNLLDIDDAVLFVKYALDENKFLNTVVSLAEPESKTVEYIVSVFEKVMGQKAITEIVVSDETAITDVVSEETIKIFGKLGVLFDREYMERLIMKYYGD